MNKVSNFLKEVTARFKGDADAIVAAKNERKANSAIKGQLSALNGKLVDDESNVEDKQEAYNNALYPTKLIADSCPGQGDANKNYVANLVKAKETLDAAKATLSSTKKSILFFEEILKSEWETQVDAES